ncbi:Flagellar hook-associated protein, FlgK [Syntrophomonas zehnderi OL-4]|uniref:Flagellar hook-associated protein 1 n=1 Tax=Syntrophomonas zehnderi OL-4 TaxID=690567 RepID=A0A0E4G9D1_9FIRM|nr:flagellar hook-associated protein FlgK [Syntrophomonas zehnderi]CFX12381.1 Flagellar hook-associated protein, FlgK [Syntrophomonas zehnderi OL-4]
MHIFGGLEIGKRSIMTHQSALNVTGHNIANANTPGYTRQMPNIVTTQPWHAPMLTGNSRVGQFGTGVDVASIDRLRDRFLDYQIRQESRTYGYWSSMQESLSRIEVILNEPSKDGLRGVMDKYWEAWQDLSVHPESESVRSVVVQRSLAMAEAFNHTHRQLQELREDVNATVRVKVDEINSIAQQLADLNKQILSISIAGKEPNDLLDKRDLLLDKLSYIADISIYEESNAVDETAGAVKRFSNAITVQLGGRPIVQGADYIKLDTIQDGQGMHMVTWADTKTKAQITGGELQGLLDIRGRTDWPEDSSEYKEIIPKMIADLNKMAKTIIVTTNNLHRNGYSLNNNGTGYLYPDGVNFFNEPSDINDPIEWAKFMSVSSVITTDPKNIAAASQPTWFKDTSGNMQKVSFGDGANALKIAQLKQKLNDSEWRIDSTAVTDLTQGSFTFVINGKTITVDNTTTPPDPLPIQSMADLVAALQKEIDADTDLKGKIMVRGNGNRITFYSTSGGFTLDGTSAAAVVNTLSNATVDDFWRSVCANTGVISQEATRMVRNQDTLLNQLENKKQSLSGVSLDEELTNMIRFQHAYNAASRFITTIDEQIDVIVNRMGLVGR